MAISTAMTAMMNGDPYGMSEREYYERRKYEEMQIHMMREAQMRNIVPQYMPQEMQAKLQQAQQPQENKLLLLL